MRAAIRANRRVARCGRGGRAGRLECMEKKHVCLKMHRINRRCARCGAMADEDSRSSQSREDVFWHKCIVFRVLRVDVWYSGTLCEDARPFAPSMSSGSRATQAKPDAQSSCSEQPPETAFFAEERGFVSAYAPRFPLGNLFHALWTRSRTVAQDGA
jgi:hypothetical protein